MMLRRCAVLVVFAAPLSAQQPTLTLPVPSHMRAQLLASNIGIGAIVGGVRALAAKRSLTRGLLYGASGGALTGAARQLVGTRRAFAGVAGRAMHDVGLGIGTLAVRDTLEVPIHAGPIVARWRPTTGQWPRVRVNVTNLVTTAMFLRDPALSIDWSASAWAGAIVVAQRQSRPGDGVYFPSAWPGTIRLTPVGYEGVPGWETSAIRRLDLAHEAIHVLQLDAMHEWIGHDAESRALRQSRAGTVIARWVEPGALGSLVGLANRQWIPYTRSPLEIEAWWLSEGRGVLGER
jgi:hypothetical protein